MPRDVEGQGSLRISVSNRGRRPRKFAQTLPFIGQGRGKLDAALCAPMARKHRLRTTHRAPRHHTLGNCPWPRVERLSTTPAACALWASLVWWRTNGPFDLLRIIVHDLVKSALRGTADIAETARPPGVGEPWRDADARTPNNPNAGSHAPALTPLSCWGTACLHACLGAPRPLTTRRGTVATAS